MTWNLRYFRNEELENVSEVISQEYQVAIVMIMMAEAFLNVVADDETNHWLYIRTSLTSLVTEEAVSQPSAVGKTLTPPGRPDFAKHHSVDSRLTPAAGPGFLCSNPPGCK